VMELEHVSSLNEFFTNENHSKSNSEGNTGSCSRYSRGTNCLRACGIIEKAVKPTSFFDKYFIFTVYGAGVDGIVVGMAEINNPENRIAAKFIRIINNDTSAFQYEVHMQKQFSALGIAPNVKESIILESNTEGLSYGVIVMDRVNCSMESLIGTWKMRVDDGELTQMDAEMKKRDMVGDIIQILITMEQKGLTHGDMHAGNIVQLSNEKTGIIDFGRSHDLCHSFFVDGCVFLALNGFENNSLIEAYFPIMEHVVATLEGYGDENGVIGGVYLYNITYSEMVKMTLAIIDSNLRITRAMARKFNSSVAKS